MTATRVPEPVDQVPADISVVSGSELRTRDAWDLSSALALVPGVEAPPGGDAGPSSSVPSFWGLHEFDAFLLVVDGTPWGGAFNPAISTLDLNDVERIEVLKGAAPVLFGATSFVGVVQVLHYPAGEAANEADIAFGSYGSARGEASIALPEFGDYKQSLAIDGQSLGFADHREAVNDGQLLYRSALDMGGGTLRMDASVTVTRDVPPSPVVRDGAALTTLTPTNANFNPANARIDENKFQIALGYSRPTAWGQWDTLLSAAHSDIVDIRAFLHPDLSGAADTQDQRRLINDDYFDTHLTTHLAGDTTLVVGADLLYGLGRQTGLNGNSGYTVPLDGSVQPPPTTAITVNEIDTIDDQRVFAGQYAQLDWKPDARWDVIAGLRLNETYEHRYATDFVSPTLATGSSNRTDFRPSETIGASYRVWDEGADEAVFYADYRNDFKPAAIDFGPDFQPAVLKPETAKSYELGIKGIGAGGALTWQGEMFLQDFQNLVVAADTGFLTNAAASRLRGVEVEARYEPAPDLVLAANFAWHDDRYVQYQFFDGTSYIDVAGNELPLSPHILASAGVLYAPPQGLNATLTVNYVGRRFLDEENTASVAGYAALAATLGYRIGRYGLTLEGTNLTNRRPPVSASEFGSSSFYLLPPRMLWLRLSAAI
ncbi:MAG TPA: TonB-dependent receptor [Rhizomicrobium sp.]|nr:TonB-dependent receptor [Rhizomicrobium sp.]